MNDYVTALEERVASFRILHPDTELEAMTESAKQWIQERLDEYVGALSTHFPSVEFPPLHWKTLRTTSILVRWISRADSASPALVFERSLKRIIHQRESKREEREFEQQRRSRLRACVTPLFNTKECKRFINALQTHNVSAEFSDEQGNNRNALVEALTRTLHCEVVWHDRENSPSPWAPLLSLWERGAIPFLDPKDEWAIFVPRPEETKAPTDTLATESYLFDDFYGRGVQHSNASWRSPQKSYTNRVTNEPRSIPGGPQLPPEFPEQT